MIYCTTLFSAKDRTTNALQTVLGMAVATSIFVLLSLHSSAYGVDYSDVLGQSEATIKVWPDDPGLADIDCEFTGVLLHDLVVKDLQDAAIKETIRGSQVKLEATITNICSNFDNQLSITLFEIRDWRGITIHFALQNSTIDSNQERLLGSSWFADVEPGEYTVRAFHYSNLNSLGIIHDIKTYELEVLS